MILGAERVKAFMVVGRQSPDMTDTRRRVLAALADGPIQGPALADQLDISRAAIWKHVDALRDAGFEIESGDNGYVLTETPEYGALAVEYGLDAPFTVEYHDVIGSTNDRARELAVEDASDIAVLADRQTGGRGRLDREWSSPSGGVWMSLVLQPNLPPARVPLLTLAAAVAVARAAREVGVDAAIKWPNDILVREANQNTDRSERGGRKLAGILTEMEGEASRVSWVIIGIGINANVTADELTPEATSLQAESEPVNRRVFVQRVLEVFDDLRNNPDSIAGVWCEHADTLGRRVRVVTPSGTVIGKAIDITDHGALIVATDNGERITVHAGDCEHLRPQD